MSIDLSTLREVLARRYPTPELARQFVIDVKLDPIRIEFKGRSDLTWFSILEEANNQGERWVRKVAEHALSQYPGDEILRRLLDGSHVQYAEGPNIRTLPWNGRGGQLLERVLGNESSLVHVSFLELGAQRARSVVRVKLANGSMGTGFLVPGNLLVTNHHVLPSAAVAAGSTIHFNYQKTLLGTDAPMEECKLNPLAFFRTSAQDDCTIVKVDGNPCERWGAIELQPAHVHEEDRVNIIQHPGGGPKQLSFFHNLVVYVGNGVVQYLTDTMPGSSGSPVFDKDWRLVALHHSGGWFVEPESRERFFRNEGILVDRVIDVLHQAQ